LLANLGDDLLGRASDLDGYRLLRFLEGDELAGKNLLVGKMAAPRAQTVGNQAGASLQIHEPHLRSDGEFLSVGALQGRTCEHGVGVSCDPMRDLRAKTLQPRSAIGIGEPD